MLNDLPVIRSQRAASTWTWTPPPASRCSTAAQQRRSGSRPAKASLSKSSSAAPICASVGRSSGAQAMTPLR